MKQLQSETNGDALVAELIVKKYKGYASKRNAKEMVTLHLLILVMNVTNF